MLRTWLPDPSFSESAKLLHDEEIHKVRGDVLFLLDVLAGRYQHMRHNPAVTMWRGSELMLVAYGTIVCQEWQARGRPDKLGERIFAFAEEALRTNALNPEENGNKPWWLGNDGFHQSHKSGLISLRPHYYQKFWPNISRDLPMVMPGPTAPGGGRLQLKEAS